LFAEFKKFAMRGSVVDLAVGVVIGAAFTAIINSLVKDVIMPPIGLLLGGIDFSNLFVVLKGSHAAMTLKAAQDAGDVTINYGQFFNAVVNFLIIAFVLFLTLRQLNKLMTSKEPPVPPPPPPEELAVLREIRDLLKTRA
jgi:large conductance mechanosensitive channel